MVDGVANGADGGSLGVDSAIAYGDLTDDGIDEAVVLVSCNLMILAPRMNPHLKAYWQAAREGRTEEARAASLKFNEYHPAASRVQGATAVAVLVSLVAGAWSLSRRVGE